jgi:ADP-heptose:LPS heptosyltransferase
VPPPDSSQPKQRIVIPVVAGIGNALLAVPMVRVLKRAWPKASITVLARTRAMAQVFERLTEVNEVFVTGNGLKGLWRNTVLSRKPKPDIYLVPFPSNRWQYAVLAMASGAKRKVLHSYPVGHWRAMHFVGERVPAKRGIHDVRQNLNLLKHLGIEPMDDEPPVFIVNDADRARADELLAGITERPIIVHAGSAQTVLAKAKRWPPTNYAELIARMEKELELPVVLIEGPDEAGIAAQIAPTAKAIKLTGPLGEAAAVLERAQLYVGSDSGLAHLASAVGTPAVTLFAPADPDRVSPHGYRHLVVQAPAPCSPCMQYPWLTAYPKICCREPMCIASITVEMVMDKVRHALAKVDA